MKLKKKTLQSNNCGYLWAKVWWFNACVHDGTNQTVIFYTCPLTPSFLHKPLGNRCPSVPFTPAFAYTYKALLGASLPSASTALALLLFRRNCVRVRPR